MKPVGQINPIDILIVIREMKLIAPVNSLCFRQQINPIKATKLTSA